MTFKHILFPVDLSDRSAGAAPHVKAMADRFGAKITLLHVMEPPIVYGDFGYLPPGDLCELELSQAKAQLALFERDVFPSHSVERRVQSGDPASVIEEHVKERGIDLVMLPTHGYGRFRRLLIGSVTAKLLHDLSIPIWTGVHMDELDRAALVQCRSIMCAIDLCPKSVALMQFAARLAARCDAVVRLVHAVPSAEIRQEKYFDLELEAYLKNHAREEIAKLQNKAGTQFDVCLEGGGVPEVVHAAALHHAADLVVIGRGELGNFLGRLRENSYAIIRESPCPVLSV